MSWDRKVWYWKTVERRREYCRLWKRRWQARKDEAFLKATTRKESIKKVKGHCSWCGIDYKSSKDCKIPYCPVKRKRSSDYREIMKEKNRLYKIEWKKK